MTETDRDIFLAYVDNGMNMNRTARKLFVHHMQKGETMTDCKWNHDEFCVNDLCPMRADYCPVPNDPGVCRWEERGMVEVVRCKDCRDYKPNPYSEGNEKLCMCWADWIPTEPDDFCSYGERRTNDTTD